MVIVDPNFGCVARYLAIDPIRALAQQIAGEQPLAFFAGDDFPRRWPPLGNYQRRATLCGEAGLKEPTEVAHSLGLIIVGAIVAALVTGDPSVADTAGRSCAAILSQARG
jgi:hypothetical protein